MENSLLEILVCPNCKGRLSYLKAQQELICLAEGYAFPIRNEIPIMLVEEARTLGLEEVEALKKK